MTSETWRFEKTHLRDVVLSSEPPQEMSTHKAFRFQSIKQTSFSAEAVKACFGRPMAQWPKKLKNRFDSCSKKSFYTNCNFLPKLDLPRNLHSGNLTFAMANGPFEDVFPMKNGDIPASYVSLPEGRPSSESISHLQEGFQPRSPHCHPQPLLEASKSPPGPNDTTTRF